MSFIETYGKYIRESYEQGNSIRVISKELSTYPNKIRRALIKMGVSLRDKSEAQSIALSSGRHKHPTKGTERSEETKMKISEAVANHWEHMSDAEYEKRVQQSRDQWERLTEEQKDDLRKAAAKGVRNAAVQGSKMERFLMEFLRDNGYEVIFHKKGLIVREDLEVDLFVPSLKLAIEVDGPAHFYPIWGEDNLKKHMQSDSRKSGLLTNAGYKIIRIKVVSKSLSQKHQRDVSNYVLSKIKEIDSGKNNKNYFELEI